MREPPLNQVLSINRYTLQIFFIGTFQKEGMESHKYFILIKEQLKDHKVLMSCSLLSLNIYYDLRIIKSYVLAPYT